MTTEEQLLQSEKSLQRQTLYTLLMVWSVEMKDFCKDHGSQTAVQMMDRWTVLLEDIARKNLND